MPDSLVCQMEGCGGLLDKENTLFLQTGCHSTSPCVVCGTCGRVHSYDGYLMYNRPGAALYFRDDRLEYILEPISFDLGKRYLPQGYLFVCLEGKEEDGVPEMVDLGPRTPIIFDGIDDDQMFRFHDESGVKYLLHRGDVNFIKEEK